MSTVVILSDQNYLCSAGVVKSEGEKLGLPPPPALRKHHVFNEIQVTQMLLCDRNNSHCLTELTALQ